MADARKTLNEVLDEVLTHEKLRPWIMKALETKQRFKCSNCGRHNEVDVGLNASAMVQLLDQRGKPADPPQRVQIDTTVRHIHALSDEQLSAIADGRADIEGVAWEDDGPGELPPAA